MLLGALRQVATYLVLALFFSFALEPAVNYMHDRWHWRRGSATALLLALVFLLLIILVLVFVPTLLKGAAAIADHLPQAAENLQSWAKDTVGVDVSTSSIASGGQEASASLSASSQTPVSVLLGFSTSLIGGIFALFTVAMFIFYMVAEAPQFRRAVLSFFRSERQEELLSIWESAIEKTGGYFYSRLLLAGINGGLFYIVLRIERVPGAAPLALFEGVVAAFIPIVGTYISATVPIVAAFKSVGAKSALVLIIYVLIYQQVENYLLSPRIQGRTMQLHPAVAFGAALAGGALGGLLWAFLALPFAATVQASTSLWFQRHDVVESSLTQVEPHPHRRRPPRNQLSSEVRASCGRPRDGSGGWCEHGRHGGGLMHDAAALVTITAALAAYALISRRLSTTIVSGPIVFMVVGVAIGPAGADLVSIQRDGELIRALLEFTLVLVLFADAMAIRSAALRGQDFVPIRLLGVGFPLSMLLGGLAALVVFGELNVWEAALLGVILAPTDASLGLATISDTRVPQLIRQALNVESGLNDGLALPFFTLALAAAAETTHAFTTGVLEVFVRSLLLSAALGGVVGWVAGRVLVWSRSKGWLDDGWARLAVIAIATLAYTLALQVHGSGFIAAWVAGLAFGTALRGGSGDPQGHDTGGLAEELGGLLVALSYVAFGAVMLGPVLAHVGWREVLYGLLSLTIIRVLPVAFASISSGLRRPTVLYMGWFGPRGLASIVFALIALEDMIPRIEVVVATVAITVGLSVLLHGISSAWGAARYGSWYAAAVVQEPNLVERGAAPERRIGRRGHRTIVSEPDVQD